jgi:putative hydrolase of the HAD superfamily
MIFFDLDGTLLDHGHAERMAALHFQQAHAAVFPEGPEAFARRWHDVAEKYMDLHFAGMLTHQGQRRARLQTLFAHARFLTEDEADSLYQTYLDDYERHWQLFPDALACLDAFPHRPLGIISNGDSQLQRRKLRALGILQRFQVVMISGDIGIAKPDARIFQAASQMGGVPPAQCCLIGDKLEVDAEAATQAGLVGIWLNRTGHTAETHAPTIRSFQELPALLTKLGLA